MSFKIIEKLVVSKLNNIKYCEDRIVYNENFACIIDGVTSKSTILYDNKKSGIVIGEILEKVILNVDYKTNLSQMLDILTLSVKNYYIEKGILANVKHNPLNRLAASLIIYSNYYNQLWMIGDCQCLVDENLYTNNKLIDIILSETRSLYITKELLEGKTINDLIKHDTGREYILPLLISQSFFQNNNFESEYSYSVIDGFPVDTSKVKVVEVGKADTIILASDGYPKLYNTLFKTEEYLKNILKNDPLCYKICKSTKGRQLNMISYDDRAYLKLKIG